MGSGSSLPVLDYKEIIEQTISGVASNFLTWAIPFCLCSFLFVIFWFRSRLSKFFTWARYCLLPFHKFNVVLSIEANDQFNSGKYYNEIVKNLNQTIDDLKLSNLVRIQDFAGIKYFTSTKEAENFREKNDIDLLIWGRFDDHLNKGGVPLNKIKLHFTYSHPKSKHGRIGAMINHELASMFSIKKYWEILESDSSADIETVSKNLTDMSLYALGLTMLIFGKISESIAIFEKLQQVNQSTDDAFLAGIKSHLINAYQIMGIEIGYHQKKYEDALLFVNKLLILEPDNFTASVNKAAFLAQTKNEVEAEAIVTRLLELYPRSAVVHVDTAYFRIVNQQYHAALKEYRKMLRLPLDFEPLDAIQWLEEQYDQNPREHAYLFGSGFINFNLRDRQRGASLLNNFLNKADPNTYSRMLYEAQRLIDSI